MLDPKMIAEIEQSSELFAEMLERLYRVYTERFGEQKAWELVKTTVFATHGGKGIA